MGTPSQEKILEHILKRNWKPVLQFLYDNRKEIKNDVLLKYAAVTFEAEFFRHLSENDVTIEFDFLEDLYILQSGKFYELSESNHVSLIGKLAERTKGMVAYNYASICPDDEICAEIMRSNEHLIKKVTLPKPEKLNKMNWVEIYNRLFELINNSSDQSTYFSGNRFIQTLREFKPYHPDYYQYIDLRNSQGKSTSRKIYYYDILMELDESTRINFVNKILVMVEPFDGMRVAPLRQMLAGAQINQNSESVQQSAGTQTTIFISYSWDSKYHKKWVLDLADRLFQEGVNVLLDRYELRVGRSLPHFVESSIGKADKILIIFTPNYKLKAENRSGGVGYEYSIMNADLYLNQTKNEKIIPILRDGQQKESIPEFMQQYIHLDMRSDENFENSLTDLLREIYDEPEVVKPELGPKRDFTPNH